MLTWCRSGRKPVSTYTEPQNLTSVWWKFDVTDALLDHEKKFWWKYTWIHSEMWGFWICIQFLETWRSCRKIQVSMEGVHLSGFVVVRKTLGKKSEKIYFNIWCVPPWILSQQQPCWACSLSSSHTIQGGSHSILSQLFPKVQTCSWAHFHIQKAFSSGGATDVWLG